MRRYKASVLSAAAFTQNAADCGTRGKPLVIIATAIEDEVSRRRGTTETRNFELTSIELFFSTENGPLLIAQDAANGAWVSIEIHDNEIFIEVTS